MNDSKIQKFVTQVFGAKGWLARNGYENNLVQCEYANAILKSTQIGQGKVCPIEAETGVGKTLGYLFILCYHASYDKRVVIATHTITLLKQLQQDLAIVQQCFMDLGVKFPLFCTRLGRDNFVNPNKLISLVSERQKDEGRDKLSQEELTLIDWAGETSFSGDGLLSGWIDEYGSFPSWLNPRSIACDAMTEPNVNLAMDLQGNLAMASPMVLTTHAMVVNHCITQSLGELENAILLLDEADKFEDAAELILNKRIQLPYVKQLVLNHGSFFPKSKSKAWGNTEKVINESIAFMDKFDTNADVIYLNSLSNENVENIVCRASDISNKLAELSVVTAKGQENTSLFEIQNELKQVSVQLAEYHKGFLNRGLAFSTVNRHPSLFTQNPKPASIIRKLLNQNCTAIFTSATLKNSTVTQRDSFSNLAAALLVKESTFEICECFAPTDFGEIDFVLTPKTVGKPYIQDGEVNNRWVRHKCQMIKVASEQHHRVLVLCSSYKELSELSSKLKGIERPLHVLARGASIGELVDGFESAGGVLLAVNLWEGFSRRCKQGEQLFTGLVITKLPFSPHDELKLNALTQYYIEQGKSSRSAVGEYFRNASTKSINKFRQGIGRLIRRSSDKGTIYIADSRFGVTETRYKQFTDAIPQRFHSKLKNASVELVDGNFINLTKTEWLDGLL
jgi:ATP-dependent DNA helicase DinG